MQTIAWVVPGLIKGSGGHRTIFQNVNWLEKNSYKCEIFVLNSTDISPEKLKEYVNENYCHCESTFHNELDYSIEYDKVFATSAFTVKYAKKLKSKQYYYFIQDYEPYFFPVGDGYISYENTYKEKFRCITIGRWLAHKLTAEYDICCNYFDFCADLETYYNTNSIKENAICCCFQYNKSRRCSSLLLDAVKIIRELRDDIEIYFFGDDPVKEVDSLGVVQLGILTPKEINELYNKCKIGISLSSTNPSRIPFEMMAAGLPFVELYRDNNLYDFPEKCCVLADSKNVNFALSVIDFFDNDKKLVEYSANCLKFMKSRNLEYGYQQFLSLVKQWNNKPDNVDRLYTCKKEVLESIKNVDTKNISDEYIYLPVEQRVINLESEINSIKDENENLKKMIDSILTSKSWQLTKPLRKINNIFKNR